MIWNFAANSIIALWRWPTANLLMNSFTVTVIIDVISARSAKRSWWNRTSAITFSTSAKLQTFSAITAKLHWDQMMQRSSSIWSIAKKRKLKLEEEQIGETLQGSLSLNKTINQIETNKWKWKMKKLKDQATIWTELVQKVMKTKKEC